MSTSWIGVVAVVIPLAACSTPSHPAVPIVPPAAGSAASIAPPPPAIVVVPTPAGFATADFIVTTNGVLATFAIVDGKVKQTGTVTLVTGDVDEFASAGVDEGDWADRDNFFVKTGLRKVVHVTASTIAPVVVPDDAAFATPKPTVSDKQPDELQSGPQVGMLQGGPGMSSAGLNVGVREAWWTQCAWGIAADGFQCSVWVSVQLWPTAKRVVGNDPVEFGGFDWKETAPAGFKTTIKSVDGRTALACVPPKGKGKSTTIEPDAENPSDEVDSVHWVSATPPRMVVVYGSPGLGSVVADRWTLHDGCAVKPLATGGTVEHGPGGLWLSGGILRRGADVIGEVPGGNLRFRPGLK